VEVQDLAHLHVVHAERAQHGPGDAVVAYERGEQVLGADVVVVAAEGLVLSEREDPFPAVVEAIEKSHAPHSRSPRGALVRHRAKGSSLAPNSTRLAVPRGFVPC
jgi:hypothetical protein